MSNTTPNVTTAIQILTDILLNRDDLFPEEAARIRSAVLLLKGKSANAETSTTFEQKDWLRIPEAMRLSGLGRSSLYKNFDYMGGSIRTASLKKPGATRGARLVSKSSILTWFEKSAESDV